VVPLRRAHPYTEKCGCSGAGSPTATSQPATRAAAQRAVSGKAANPDLNDPQFWAGVGPAVFHGLQAIAKLGQSTTAPAAMEAMEWPIFSRNLADYPEFEKRLKSARQKCSAQLEDDQLCEIFREKCMPPALQRRLAYFLTMSQVWDFLDVAMDKPRRAMEACVMVIEKMKPVKPDSSKCLRIRYEELRAIGEQAKAGRVYSYLLTKAVADKITGGLPPAEKEAMRARVGKSTPGNSTGDPQSTEKTWDYVWKWSPAQLPAARPRAAKTTPPTKKEVPSGGVQGSFPPASGVRAVPWHRPHQSIHPLPYEAVVHYLPRRSSQVVQLDQSWAASLPGGRSQGGRMC
jgi:hypothetical protein